MLQSQQVFLWKKFIIKIINNKLYLSTIISTFAGVAQW